MPALSRGVWAGTSKTPYNTQQIGRTQTKPWAGATRQTVVREQALQLKPADGTAGRPAKSRTFSQEGRLAGTETKDTARWAVPNSDHKSAAASRSARAADLCCRSAHPARMSQVRLGLPSA